MQVFVPKFYHIRNKKSGNHDKQNSSICIHQSFFNNKIRLNFKKASAAIKMPAAPPKKLFWMEHVCKLHDWFVIRSILIGF